MVCTENMYYELFMMIPFNEELKLINDFGRTEVMQPLKNLSSLNEFHY